MFDNMCLWYDEAREEHDRYLAECEVKEAYKEFDKLVYTIEEYELTEEQFNKLPDEAFPDSGTLTYMDYDELESLLDKIDNCIGVLRDILAEVTNH